MGTDIHSDLTDEHLSVGQQLRLSWPFLPVETLTPKEEFVHNRLASACIVPLLRLATNGMFLGIAIYALFLHGHSTHGGYWLAFGFVFLGLNLIAEKHLRNAMRAGKLNLKTTHITLLSLVIIGGLYWGSFPALIADKHSLRFAFAVIVSLLIVLGSVTWIIGLPYLTIIHGTAACIPMLFSVYGIYDGFHLYVTAAIFFVLNDFMLALFFTEQVILVNLRSFRVIEQNEFIERHLNEYQIHSDDWVWETDADGKVTFITSEQLKLTLSEKNNLFTELFKEKDNGTVALRQNLEFRKPFEKLVVDLPKGSEVRQFELRGQPIFDRAGAFIGFRGFGHDVSSIYELNEMRFAEEKFAILSKFVGKIAHDFNNSLMVVSSCVDFLKFGGAENKDEESSTLDAISSAVKSASHVNKELLSYVRQEVLSPSEVSLTDCLNTAADQIRMCFPKVDIAINGETDVFVYVDKFALSRALENIFLNAVEAQAGEGKIEVSVAKSEGKQSLVAEILVKDFGQGFSSEALKMASDPFFTTKGQDVGSGLGLSTVAGFAMQSSGEFTWGNHSQGAWVKLNLIALRQRETQAKAEIDAQPIDSTKAALLIVDDDLGVLLSLEKLLAPKFAKVETASRIDEAIERVNESGEKFDAVLCDYHFEGDSRTGVDIFHDVNAKVGVFIFMTGYSSKVEELTGCHVIPKPFSVDEFMQAYFMAHKATDLRSSGLTRA